MVSAREVLAISLAGNRPTGGGIHLEDEDAAGVRAVDHPELAALVEEHVGIDRVRHNAGVIVSDAGWAVTRGDLGRRHAGTQEDALIDVAAVDAVRHRGAQIRTRACALSAGRDAAEAVIEVVLAVLELDDVRGP